MPTTLPSLLYTPKSPAKINTSPLSYFLGAISHSSEEGKPHMDGLDSFEKMVLWMKSNFIFGQRDCPCLGMDALDVA